MFSFIEHLDKKIIIKYRGTTISVNYWTFERYRDVLLGGDFDKEVRAKNTKFAKKKIREELDRMYQQKQERTKVSQYVEHWLIDQTVSLLYKRLEQSENRNKSQREALKKKYSIIEKDKLLEKISCLERKIYDYKYPQATKEELKRLNKALGKNITYEEILNEKCE